MAKKPPKDPKVIKFPGKGKPLVGEYEVVDPKQMQDILNGMLDRSNKKRKSKGKVEVAKTPENEPQVVTDSGKKMGRPTLFTPELALEICERVGNGEALSGIAEDEHMPSRITVYNWLDDAKTAEKGSDLATFLTNYTRARERQADSLMDDVILISDKGKNDWMERFGKDGDSVGWYVNGEAIQRSRLRVETRLRMAAMFNPKKYAPMQKHANADGENLPTPEQVNDLDLARRIAYVLAGASKKVENPE